MENEMELTKVEVEIMKVIWDAPEEISMKEILKIFNVDKAAKWKPQTMTTYLNRLVKKGAVSMRRQGRIFLYRPLISRDDFFQKEVNAFVHIWGEETPASLFAAFSDDHPLSEKEKEELRRLIDDLD